MTMTSVETQRRQELADKGMTLAFWADRQGDREAIISPTGTRTFKELNENANRLARALRRRGLRAGDACARAAGVVGGCAGVPVAGGCDGRPGGADVPAPYQRLAVPGASPTVRCQL